MSRRKIKTRNTFWEKRLALQAFAMKTSFRVGLLATVSVFVILNVLQTSALSTKGYDLSVLQNQIRELENENRHLAYKIAKHGSMESLEKRLAGMEMVQEDAVRYAFVRSATVVAQR